MQSARYLVPSLALELTLASPTPTRKGGSKQQSHLTVSPSRMGSRKFCPAQRMASAGLRVGEEAQTQTGRERRLNCPGVLRKGSLHTPRPCCTSPSLVPPSPRRDKRAQQYEGPESKFIPTTYNCGLLGKVFNVSFVNR